MPSETPESCPTCDRPRATDELWEHDGGCECAECCTHCWENGGDICREHAVDWRGRALAAEAKLGSFRRNHLGPDEPPCDKDECMTCGILLCPHHSETHLWHDGCGVCDAAPSAPATPESRP